MSIEDAGKASGERNVRVEMFSAERRKAAGPFEGMTGNPVLSLFLENNIQQLSALLHGNPRYLKNAIRRALRTAPSTPDQIDGQKQAWRVEVAPFKDDPQKDRMNGLETLTYVFRVAPDLPGAVYEIDISARDPAGAVLLEEKLLWQEKLTSPRWLWLWASLSAPRLSPETATSPTTIRPRRGRITCSPAWRPTARPQELHKFSCSAGRGASILPYDKYVEAETMLSMRQGVGRQAEVLRNMRVSRLVADCAELRPKGKSGASRRGPISSRASAIGGKALENSLPRKSRASTRTCAPFGR